MPFFYFIPDDLDTDLLLNQHDFTGIKGFHKDKLHYIIHLVSEIPSNNKDLINEDGFVPLNATLLRQWLGNYKEYVDYLLRTGVLICDNRYILGEKSRGYKISDRYSHTLKRVIVTDLDLIKRQENWYEMKDLSRQIDEMEQEMTEQDIDTHSNVSRRVYLPIARWYNTDIISIDEEAATAYNRSTFEHKIGCTDRSRWDWTYDYEGGVCYKNPYVQYMAGQRNIDKIASGLFNVHADDNIFRVHSAVTNCKKELRQYIKLNDQNVVSVDLSNSQPTLFSAILNLDFWENRGDFKSNHIPYLNIDSIFKDNTHYTTLIMLLKSIQDNESIGEEVRLYKEWVSSGLFYSHFRQLLYDRLRIQVETDSEVKPVVFTALFTANRYLNNPKRVFRELFPFIYQVMSIIKRSKSNNLAVLLQRIESYIMYYRIVPKIAQQRPLLPILTLHDSIATTDGNQAFIESIMKEELSACLGITPHFKHEIWQPNQTEYPRESIQAA